MKIKSQKWIARENLKNWRNAVLKRDGNKCVICGGYFPSCHHIIPKQFKEFKYDVNNGICLCYNHHKVGKLSPHQNALWWYIWLQKNRPEQFEYLKNIVLCNFKDGNAK